MKTYTNILSRLRSFESGAFYLEPPSGNSRTCRYRVVPCGSVRQFLQRTLDSAEDYFACTNEAWLCFHVMSLKRRLGLRYWRMGK